ncbi:unnamed protein product [Rhizophagus irregularis]|nr:unnamed protein product [Rhizophagus irregularis]
MKVTDNMCSDHSLFFTSLFDGIQLISIVTNNGSIDDDVLLVTDNTAFEEKAVPIPSGSFYRGITEFKTVTRGLISGTEPYTSTLLLIYRIS